MPPRATALALILSFAVATSAYAVEAPCGDLVLHQQVPTSFAPESIALRDGASGPELAWLSDRTIYLNGAVVVPWDGNRTYQYWLRITADELCYVYTDQRTPGWKLGCSAKDGSSSRVVWTPSMSVGLEGFADANDTSVSWVTTSPRRLSYRLLGDSPVRTSYESDGGIRVAGPHVFFWNDSQLYYKDVRVSSELPAIKIPPAFQSFRYAVDAGGRWLVYEQYFRGGPADFDVDPLPSKRLFLYDTEKLSYEPLLDAVTGEAYRMTMHPVHHRPYVVALHTGWDQMQAEAWVKLYSGFTERTYTVMQNSEKTPGGSRRVDASRFDASGRYLAFSMIENDGSENIWVCRFDWTY